MTREELFVWAEAEFGVCPEHPFEGDTVTAVLRHGTKGKWFAIVMRIPRSRLEGTDGEPVDVMNLKCDPRLIGSLRLQPGFYPAYHMNKTHWVTVLLDGSVPAETIRPLLEMSYDLTKPRRRAISDSAPE